MTDKEALNSLQQQADYKKPLPPSTVIDLQPGVKIRDRYSNKGGGEFTMTMRG